MKKLFLLVLLCSFPASAWALECQTDADCSDGYYCEMLPCTCAMPACEDGAECPEAECEPCPGECVAEATSTDTGWTTGECTADADCPQGFACVETTYGYCGGAIPDCEPCTCACEEGQPCNCEDECPPCETSEPPECSEGTIMVCEYQPQTCAADSDCAEGFECVAQEACTSYDSCVSCACPVCPEGETCEPCDCPEVPDECVGVPSEPVCETLGSYCVPKQVECTQDSDCPDDWSCTAMPVACPAIACDCVCPEGTDCDCTEECPVSECDESSKAYCLPGGWYEAGFSDAAALGSDTFMDKGVTEAANTHTEEPTVEPSDTDTDSDGTAQTGTDGSSSGCAAMPNAAASTSLLALLSMALLALASLRRVRR